MDLRHFLIEEFDSPDLPGSGAKYMDREFLEMIDAAAHLCKLQFIVMAGYRSTYESKRHSDASNSSHRIGRAAILQCSHHNKRYKMITSLLEVGFTRIGICKDGKSIYVDNDYQKPDSIFLYI
jgi:hypothetical protein